MSVIAAGAAAGIFAAATLQGDQASPHNLAGQFNYRIEKSIWTDLFFHKSAASLTVRQQALLFCKFWSGLGSERQR